MGSTSVLICHVIAAYGEYQKEKEELDYVQEEEELLKEAEEQESVNEL